MFNCNPLFSDCVLPTLVPPFVRSAPNRLYRLKPNFSVSQTLSVVPFERLLSETLTQSAILYTDVYNAVLLGLLLER